MNIFRLFFTLSLVVIVSAALIFGCRENSSYREQPEKKLVSVVINGYAIPVFPTAEEQFNYTRSWFKDFDEKKASLQGVIQLYPKARLQCGLASLDLAYSLMGNDHRLASKEEYLKAIAQYKELLSSFSDIPEIIAKSYWYTGWIYCDLLKDTTSGIREYQTIISQFPDVAMNLASPVPWVSIVYPFEHTSGRSLDNKPHISWSNLAALEIIRQTEEDSSAWEALQVLWKKNPSHNITGIGLKLLLQRKSLFEKIQPLANEYLRNAATNPYLHKDIETALTQISTGSTHQKGGAE